MAADEDVADISIPYAYICSHGINYTSLNTYYERQIGEHFKAAVPHACKST